MRDQLPTDMDGLVLRRLSHADGDAYLALVDQNEGHLRKYGDYGDVYPATRDSIDAELARASDDQAFGLWGGNLLIGRVDLVPPRPDEHGQVHVPLASEDVSRASELRLDPAPVPEAERWGAASLYGKLADIVGEMNDRSIETSALFKQIVGNDSIMAEHKNKPLFEFTPFCKMIFSANRPPMTRDQSNAFFERWLIIPFDQVYAIQPDGDAREADTQLSAKLWHPAELSGLAKRAVDGLGRVRERGWRFDVPASVMAETERYRLTADSVASFLGEMREKGDPMKDSERLSEMYRDYSFWCRDSGRRELSRVNFVAQIEELFEPRDYRVTGSGGTRMIWGWKPPAGASGLETE